MTKAGKGRKAPPKGHQREIRRYVNPVGPIFAITIAGAFIALGVILWLYSPRGWWIGAILSCVLSILALQQVIILVNCLLVRTPQLLIDSTGFTYAAPYVLWRTRHIPWADISAITIDAVFRSSGRGGSASARMLVHTHHPDRYRSALKRRLSTWWNPPRRDAAISFRIGASLKARTKFMKTLQTRFESEISQNRISVKWSS